METGVPTEVIHDVLYSLHKKESIHSDALLSDFDRRCKRIAGFLLWTMAACNQVRQLEAAHDFQHAADLERFGLPALNLADKWLSLRIERAKLRMGMYAGGSDKVAVLAVVAGAWSLWRGFPDAGSTVEQNLYLGCGAFLCGTGIGGMFANRMIARMSYQRDLVAISICRLMNC